MKLYYITLNSSTAAIQVGRNLVEQNLASWYRWFAISSAYAWAEETFDRLGAVKLIIETKLDDLDKIEQVIRQQTDYESQIIEIAPGTVLQELCEYLDSAELSQLLVV